MCLGKIMTAGLETMQGFNSKTQETDILFIMCLDQTSLPHSKEKTI